MTDVLDEVVSLFDQAVSAREGKAERTMRDALAERGKADEDRQARLCGWLMWRWAAREPPGSPL